MDSETENSHDLVVPETPEHITQTPYSDYTTGSYSSRRRRLFSDIYVNQEKAMCGSWSMKSEHCSRSPSHVLQTPGQLVQCGKSLIGESTSSTAAIPSPLRYIKSEHYSLSPTHVSPTPGKLSSCGKFLIGEATSSVAAIPSPLHYVKSENCTPSPSNISQTPGMLADCCKLLTGEAEATTSIGAIPSLNEECECNNEPAQISYWEFVYHYFIPEYTKERLTLSEWFSLRKCAACSRKAN